MTDTADHTMLTRINKRKVGSDAMLDFIAADKRKIPLTVTLVTKIETFKKTSTADSGNEQTVVRYFTERGAYLVTIKNWDAVADQETCLRTQIGPMLCDQLKLDPKVPVVLQFLDSKGTPIQHVAEPGPKVMAPGD